MRKVILYISLAFMFSCKKNDKDTIYLHFENVSSKDSIAKIEAQLDGIKIFDEIVKYSNVSHSFKNYAINNVKVGEHILIVSIRDKNLMDTLFINKQKDSMVNVFVSFQKEEFKKGDLLLNGGVLSNDSVGFYGFVMSMYNGYVKW